MLLAHAEACATTHKPADPFSREGQGSEAVLSPSVQPQTTTGSVSSCPDTEEEVGLVEGHLSSNRANSINFMCGGVEGTILWLSPKPPLALLTGRQERRQFKRQVLQP